MKQLNVLIVASRMFNQDQCYIGIAAGLQVGGIAIYEAFKNFYSTD